MKQLLLSAFICIGLYANGQVNLIHDENFESADFSRVYVESDANPASANVWAKVIQSGWTDANVIINAGNDATRLKTAQMELFATAIATNAPYRAFIVQRVGVVADAALYKFSFWAKTVSGTPTVRIFVKLDAYTNHYFIFDTGKPTSPTGTYTAYCKNLPLVGTEWNYFENVVDLSKKTTSRGAILYTDAIATTVAERTNVAVCLQNNAASSSIQIDDVVFSKVDVGTGFSETGLTKGLAYKVVGNEVFVSNTDAVLDVIDVSGRLVKSIAPAENNSFNMDKKGVYLLKYKQMRYKILIN